jgi:hypothetical protein
MTKERHGVAIFGASKIATLHAETIMKVVSGLELKAIADPISAATLAEVGDCTSVRGG